MLNCGKGNWVSYNDTTIQMVREIYISEVHSVLAQSKASLWILTTLYCEVSPLFVSHLPRIV